MVGLVLPRRENDYFSGLPYLPIYLLCVRRYGKRLHKAIMGETREVIILPAFTTYRNLPESLAPRQTPDVVRRRVSCPAPSPESPIPDRPDTGRRRPRKKRATQSYGDGWPIVCPADPNPPATRYPARGARIASRIRRASAFRSPCIAAVARLTTRGR